MFVLLECVYYCIFVCLSRRRRHTRCALVTGVQTCALPISSDPGDKEVLTHGFTLRPRSTAFLARRPAASITDGLDVLVQLVIAAMTTWPWSRVQVSLSTGAPSSGNSALPGITSCSKARATSGRLMRSCGRLDRKSTRL